MSEWKEVIASAFCTEVTDGTHDSPKPVSVGKYLLTSKHLQEYSLDFANAYMISQEDYDKVISRSKVDQYDVLFSMIGTIGTTHRVTVSYVDFAVKNMGIFKFGGDSLKSKWLYYWLKTRESKEYINSCLSGTTQGYMTLKALRNFPISVPDPLTMESITSILSSLDDKIAVNKKICENLEAQAQALFKHWFVDFAPFKDGKFVESELGLIPEGWRVGTLGDICSYSTKRISIDNLSPKTYYSTENMLPNKMGAVEASSLPQVGMTTGCEPFDVLVSNIRPYFKKILRVYSICGCSSDVMCFHTTDSKYRAYLYRTLYDDSFFSYIMAGSKGTKMPRGDKKQIMKYPIVLPHESILEHFSNCVEPMFLMISSLKQESSRLATLRDTLLPKLMSGQIKVNEIAL